jgi:hypothetical protein
VRRASRHRRGSGTCALNARSQRREYRLPRQRAAALPQARAVSRSWPPVVPRVLGVVAAHEVHYAVPGFGQVIEIAGSVGRAILEPERAAVQVKNQVRVEEVPSTGPGRQVMFQHQTWQKPSAVRLSAGATGALARPRWCWASLSALGAGPSPRAGGDVGSGRPWSCASRRHLWSVASPLPS